MLKLLRRFFADPVPPVPASPVESVSSPALDYRTLALQRHKPVLSGEALIALLELQPRIAILRELMGLPLPEWQRCCLSAIYAFAEAVQLAPASEAHHHAYAGGLLVHTVDALDIALRLRRKYQLPPRASAELVNSAGIRWTYGVFCAVLLHDPGKIGTAVQLVGRAADGIERTWSALQGSMVGQLDSYEIRFSRVAPYKLHNQVSLALLATVIPEAGRRWLAEDQTLLQHLTAAVYDVHDASAGAIGEILAQADGQSVAKDLGHSAPKNQHTGAKAIPLADKYMRTLRHLIAGGKFKINKPGAQLFVTRRKGIAEADSDAWILCRAAAEAIVEELRRSDSSVPMAPENVYDTLQEHGLLTPSPAGRAIWPVAVHADDWRAEFTMLRFPAWRVFATGSVPKAFAGSVKPKKTLKSVGSEKTLSQPDTQPVQPAQRFYLEDAAPTQLGEHTLDQPEPADTGAANNPLTLNASANPDPVAQQQQALLQQLLGKPPKPAAVAKVPKPAAAKAPQAQPDHTAPAGTRPAIAETVVSQLYDKVHDSHHADDFFSWLAAEIRHERLEFNSPTAIAHAHQDGLLLVSPKVFRVYAESCAADWTKVQKAVNQSGYVLQEKHRHVHAYLIKNPRGAVGKSLSCAVVEPATCKALLPPLPEVNPMILGRS